MFLAMFRPDSSFANVVLEPASSDGSFRTAGKLIFAQVDFQLYLSVIPFFRLPASREKLMTNCANFGRDKARVLKLFLLHVTGI